MPYTIVLSAMTETLQGSLWKMKKGITGSVYWRKNWVSADHEKLEQYTSKSKPPEEEEPKYVVLLSSCVVEELSIRKFCFKISDATNGTDLVFACDNFSQYESWLKFIVLRNKKGGLTSPASVGKSAAGTHSPTPSSTGAPAAPGYEAGGASKGGGSVASTDLSSHMFEQLQEDFVADYFQKHNETQDTINPCIKETALSRLIHALDLTLNAQTVLSLLFKDLKLKSGDLISFDEFNTWWLSYADLLLLEPITPGEQLHHIPDPVSAELATGESDSRRKAVLATNEFTETPGAVHLAGFVETYAKRIIERPQQLLRAAIPNGTMLSGFVPPVFDFFGEGWDWNANYQTALEYASDLQSELAEGISHEPGKTAKEIAAIANATADVVDACLKYSALKGAFYKCAVEGVRVIIDEYSLPNYLKTVPPLAAVILADEVELAAASKAAAAAAAAAKEHSKPEDNKKDKDKKAGADGSVTEGIDIIPPPPSLPPPTPAEVAGDIRDPQQLLYTYKGLMLRIVACVTEEQDIKLSTSSTASEIIRLSRKAYIAATDEYEHKVCGVEQRAVNFMRDSISTLVSEHGQDVRWLHRQQQQQQQHAAPNYAAVPHPHHATGHWCTPLSTIVDYCGFRVSVTCCPPVAETSPYTSPQVDGTSAAAGSAAAVDESHPPESLIHGFSSKEKVFVNSLPAFRAALHRISHYSNLALSRRRLRVRVSPLKRDANGKISTKGGVSEGHVEMLAADMEAHLHKEARRVYLINYKSVLPPDLPRADSLDLYTRVLRPEFVRSCSVPLQAAALRDTEAEKLLCTGPTGGTHQQDTAKQYLATVSLVYKRSIPSAALLLDSLSALPVDPFGLSTFLHTRGVCTRHMGVLYYLCRTTWARQTIFSDMVARCVKSIVREVTRGISRDSMIRAIIAQRRNRSRPSDFFELQGNVIEKQKEAVLDIFNRVFGVGEDVNNMWNLTLADMLYQKFGVRFPAHEKDNALYLPQLFHFTQYHTGTRFRDILYHSQLGSVECPEPFTGDDIVEYFVPAVKSTLEMPGEIGMIVEKSADDFVALGLYEEASHIFQLQLTALNLIYEPTSTSAAAALKTVAARAAAANVASRRPGDPAIQVAMSQAAESMQGMSTVSSYPARQLQAASHVLYKYAMCCFLSSVRSGNFKTQRLTVALDSLRSHIASHAKYSATTGRMLTLLMCAEFMRKNIAKAKSLFDAAQEIYMYTLGPRHPVLCLHVGAFGDLYHQFGHHSQAKVMILVAQATARTSLGGMHPVAASYQCKLAALFAAEGNHEKSVELLLTALALYDKAIAARKTAFSSALATIGQGYRKSSKRSKTIRNGESDSELSAADADDFDDEEQDIGNRFNTNDADGMDGITQESDEISVALANDTMECLYSLCVSLFKLGELDLAIHTGFRCVEMGSKLYKSYPPTSLISCLLYLCDLFVAKKEYDSAFEILQEAWTALRQRPFNSRSTNTAMRKRMPPPPPAGSTAAAAPVVSKKAANASFSPYDSLNKEIGVGATLVRIACRAMELTVRSLPMQTRSLLDSVCEEVEKGGHGACDEGSWDAACSLVVKAIWLMHPSQYFSIVIEGIQSVESADITDPDQATNISASTAGPAESKAALSENESIARLQQLQLKTAKKAVAAVTAAAANSKMLDEIARVPFALQTAIIFRLIRKPTHAKEVGAVHI